MLRDVTSMSRALMYDRYRHRDAQGRDKHVSCLDV
jgi:hypothetical protein